MLVAPALPKLSSVLCEPVVGHGEGPVMIAELLASILFDQPRLCKFLKPSWTAVGPSAQGDILESLDVGHLSTRAWMLRCVTHLRKSSMKYKTPGRTQTTPAFQHPNRSAILEKTASVGRLVVEPPNAIRQAAAEASWM